MDFSTQIAQLDAAELDKFFEPEVEGTPTVKDLAAGEDLKGGDDDDEKVVVINQGGAGLDGIQDAPDDLFDDIEDEEDTTKKDDKKAEDEEIIGDEDEEIADPNKKEDKKEEKKEEKTKVDPTEVASFLKTNVEYLIETGLWSDFEGREDLEMTQEVYAELAKKQAQHTASEIVSEMVDSTGAYGKAIISHIKAGGDPDEIIDLFKEQKSVEQIDVSTEAGKQAKIERYYKDVLGWKPERVEKLIKRVVEDNDVDAEFNEVEELYDEHYKARLAESATKVEEQKVKARENQVRFTNSIQAALDENTELTAKDKKLIASSILDFKHKLDGGQKVNDFYLKFADMQKDPKEYVELVRFVMDRENYKKSIQTVAKSTAAKEAFNFIKGNSVVSKKQTTDLKIEDDGGKKTHSGTNFSFAIKK